MTQAKIYMVTSGDLLASARRLMEAKEITLGQYSVMLRRSKEVENVL